MSDRRRWTADEIDLLVDFMEKPYDFITSAKNPSKTKTMVEGKWEEVASQVNALGAGHSLLSVTQIKKKWAD